MQWPLNFLPGTWGGGDPGRVLWDRGRGGLAFYPALSPPPQLLIQMLPPPSCLSYALDLFLASFTFLSFQSSLHAPKFSSSPQFCARLIASWAYSHPPQIPDHPYLRPAILYHSVSLLHAPDLRPGEVLPMVLGGSWALKGIHTEGTGTGSWWTRLLPGQTRRGSWPLPTSCPKKQVIWYIKGAF